MGVLFAPYMAVRMEDLRTRDMLAFFRLIVHEALQYGVSGWQEYDQTFQRNPHSPCTLVFRWPQFLVVGALWAACSVSLPCSGTFVSSVCNCSGAAVDVNTCWHAESSQPQVRLLLCLLESKELSFSGGMRVSARVQHLPGES